MSVIKVSISGVTEGEAQKIFNAIGRPNENLENRSYFQHCGFSSIPRKSAIGVVLKDGDNYTMIASADHEDDRPVLSNDGDCCMYSSKNRYIKIDNSTGDITAKNDSGTITLKNNGDVELGEGVNLKDLVTEELINKLYTVATIPVNIGLALAGPYPAGTLSGCLTTKTKAV